MTPNEVYEKYKHLDQVLCDKDWLAEIWEHDVIYDLWQTIKGLARPQDSADISKNNAHTKCPVCGRKIVFNG